MNIEKIKKQNTIIFLLGAILISLLFFNLYHQYLNLDKTKREIILEEQKIDLLEERVARLIFLKEQMPELTAKFELLEQLLPKHLSEQDVIGIIQDSLLGTRGTVSEIRFKEIIKKKSYQQFPFQVVFEGDFYGLLQFLQNLNHQPPLITIQSVAISTRSVWSEEGAIRADLKVAVYHTD